MHITKTLARMPTSRAIHLPVLVVLFALAPALPPASAHGGRVSRVAGSIIPAGPPLSRIAVDAGNSCVIDIVLPYIITGTLAGTAEIDYRIDVKGPCAEAAPGKFDETWIARGTFSGSPGDASFVYTADVKAGGKIRGEIVLGQGLAGRLWVKGNLTDTQLHYRGFVK